MKSSRLLKILTLLLLASTLVPMNANANSSLNPWQEIKKTKWEDGRLRIEGQWWTASRSGRRSRTGDDSVVGTVEKEFPFALIDFAVNGW